MKFNIYTGSNLVSEIFIVIKRMLLFQKFYDSIVVEKYEKKFSKKVNKKYGFAFGSGRMSLYAGLKSIGLKKNDEIIIPAFTCVVVANAIKYTGAKIVYCDISKKNFNINLNDIKNLITKQTKAIYIQHTFGHYCNFNSLIKICRSKNISIVEDCAHYFPEKIKLGTFGKKSDFVFFSTDHSKFINTHLGGMVLTDDEIIAKKLKKIKYKAYELSFLNNFLLNLSFIFENFFYHPKLYMYAKIFIKILSKFKVLFYFRDELDLNKPLYYPTKLNSYQALIGIKQLQNIENNIKHRKKIVGLLNKSLDIKSNSKYPLLRYSFLIKSRDKFIKSFSRYFDLDIWYETVLHGRKTDFKKLGYKKGSCKNAEFVCNHIVNFPTHLKIDFKYFKKILSVNKTYIKKNILNE